MLQGPLSESILKRAQEQRLLSLHFTNLREFGKGRYRQVDDSPYGGGAGMVLKCEPLVTAIEEVMKEGRNNIMLRSSARPSTGSSKIPRVGGRRAGRLEAPHRIYLSPHGKRLTQARVEQLAKKPWLLLLCGHYEGVDQRVIDGWIDEEISIGDYVLTGGELPALVLIDALARQIPGVLGAPASAKEESFTKALGRRREYPHYTRPEEFRGQHVPEILLSGDHKKVKEWRRTHLK